MGEKAGVAWGTTSNKGKKGEKGERDGFNDGFNQMESDDRH